MKRFAVVISGCGFKDGAEITESISTILALSETKVEYEIFAPDITFEAVDHVSGEKSGMRNVLSESARIARGQISGIKKLKPENFDAIVFPGGFGAAKNLCTFATQGSACTVLPEVRSVIEEFHDAGKPIGAFCIAPALIAAVLGKHHIAVTIGNDKETAREIEKTGARHVACSVDDYVTDREHKIVTSPAYMYDARPFDVYTGIRKAIHELVGMG